MKLKSTIGALVGALILAGALASAASASTVTTTADGGPGSLRQLLAEARPGETITVPAGNYAVTRGEMKINRAVTIAGAGASTTTLDAQKTSRLFNIRTVKGEAVTISGLTLTNGISRANFGAALVSELADLTLRDDVVSRNATGLHEATFVFGGAVYAAGGNDLEVIDTKFLENSGIANGSAGEAGGGAFAVAMLANAGTVEIEESSFEGNVADARGGLGANGGEVEGIVDVAAESGARVVDSTFANNVLDARGGSDGRDGFAGGALHISTTAPRNIVAGVTVTGNVARAGTSGEAVGAGMQIIGPNDIAVTGSTIVDNTVEGALRRSHGANVFTAAAPAWSPSATRSSPTARDPTPKPPTATRWARPSPAKGSTSTRPTSADSTPPAISRTRSRCSARWPTTAAR